MTARILLVDDEPSVIQALTLQLQSGGYEVITAKDGLEALEKARRENPDLILLDIMLPKLDGYKVARMLKFDEKYRQIPIIILTAKGADANKKVGQEVGADVYMTKPFDPTQLMQKIKGVLASRGVL